MLKRYLCHNCGVEFPLSEPNLPYINEHNKTICDNCWELIKNHHKNIPTSGIEATQFNKPTHYHMHDMDTITFLQKGFPPEVCMGFLVGNVIKYAQRANYKNGREDFVKMVDYAKRALDWYDQTTEKS
jgi:hypothetical protein